MFVSYFKPNRRRLVLRAWNAAEIFRGNFPLPAGFEEPEIGYSISSLTGTGTCRVTTCQESPLPLPDAGMITYANHHP